MKKLYYQKELEGEQVQFQYKPTERSRIWRDGFINNSYSIIAFEYGQGLQDQEKYYECRFINWNQEYK